MLFLGTATMWTSCNKELPQEPSASDAIHDTDGAPKLLGYFVQMQAGAAPRQFGVQLASLPLGVLASGGGTGSNMTIVAQPPGLMHVTGSSEYPYCTGMNPGVCVFERPGASYSQWYYITPNQSNPGFGPRKTLKVRLKPGATLDPSETYFRFWVSKNSWHVDDPTAANLVCEWAIVTSVPLPVNC